MFVDGPTILFEFAGCAHLAAGIPTIDEIRPAPSITAKKTIYFEDEIAAFADEVRAECRRHLGGDALVLAVEKMDFPMTDALRARDVRLADATMIMQLAMAIKQPTEITAMRERWQRSNERRVSWKRRSLPDPPRTRCGRAFHHGLIANGGEFIVTRLLQAGDRTFPYFLESSDHRLAADDWCASTRTR